MKAVTCNGYLIAHARDRLKNNTEVFLEAVKSKPEIVIDMYDEIFIKN